MPGAIYLLLLLHSLHVSDVVAPPADTTAAGDSAAAVTPPATSVSRQTPEPPQPSASRPATGARSQQEQDRWALAVDLGFSSSSGNSDLTSLTTGLRLKHLQTRLYKLEWGITFRYGESQGEVVARNLQSKLDFDVGPGSRIAPFVFATAERDAFKRLDLRARTGSGARYAFYRGDAGNATFRVALQYSRETFTPVANRATKNDALWNMELKGQQRLGETVRLENTTTFDPVYDDFGDHNIESRSKLSSRISQRLALTLQHQYSYDSTPAPKVGRTDQRFQAGLTIEF